MVGGATRTETTTTATVVKQPLEWGGRENLEKKLFMCLFILGLITISLGAGNAQAAPKMDQAVAKAKAGGGTDATSQAGTCTCSSMTTCSGGACCCAPAAPARTGGGGTSALRKKMADLQDTVEKLKKEVKIVNSGGLDHCQTYYILAARLKMAGMDATIQADATAAGKACSGQFDRAPQLADENFKKMLVATAKYGVNVSADRRGFVMTPPSVDYLAERTRPYREGLQAAMTSEKERREATLNAMLSKEAQLQQQLDEGVSPAWPWWLAAVAGPAVGVGGGLISKAKGDSTETSAWVGGGVALGTAALSLAISGITYYVQKKGLEVRLKVAHDSRVAYTQAQKPLLQMQAPTPPKL